VKLVHLVGFIIKKFVTMHGHMNVKLLLLSFSTARMVNVTADSLPFERYVRFRNILVA